MPEEEIKDNECLTDFSNDYPGYLVLTSDEIFEMAKKYS